jgi:hypothetical protein
MKPKLFLKTQNETSIIFNQLFLKTQSQLFLKTQSQLFLKTQNETSIIFN